MRLLVLLATIAVVGDAIAMPACRAASGPALRPLVELYTSEGCSSCPPADRWLSRHFPPGAAGDAIAIAFHVDYWDRLGWKDRFASPVHTARQHQAMRANRAGFVYTPQVLLMGRDYPGWRRGAPSAALRTAASPTSVATIAVAASVGKDAVVADVSVTLSGAPDRGTMLALAYTDSALGSEVTAGENRGERLVHDHVVRAFETRGLAGEAATFSVRMPRPTEAGAHPTLVAFVQDTDSGDVLQAVALPLSECGTR